MRSLQETVSEFIERLTTPFWRALCSCTDGILAGVKPLTADNFLLETLEERIVLDGAPEGFDQVLLDGPPDGWFDASTAWAYFETGDCYCYHQDGDHIFVYESGADQWWWFDPSQQQWEHAYEWFQDNTTIRVLNTEVPGPAIWAYNQLDGTYYAYASYDGTGLAYQDHATGQWFWYDLQTDQWWGFDGSDWTMTDPPDEVNDPPVVQVTGIGSVAEDTGLIDLGAVFFVDDPDSPTLTVEVTGATGFDSLVVGSGTGSATVSQSGAVDWTIHGSVDDVNAALDTLNGTLTGDFNGTAMVTISATDGVSTASDTLDVSVTPVQDDPTLILTQPAPVNEDGNPVNLNDAVRIDDPDVGDTITVTLDALQGYAALNLTPVPGIVTQLSATSWQVSGSLSQVNNALASLSGTLAQDYNGTARISVNGSDGRPAADDTGLIDLTVNAVNDAPDAVNDSGTGYSTDEYSAFTTANVLTNDTDPDTSDTLSVDSIDTSGTQGSVIDNGNGTFYYDPNGQFEYLALGEPATDTFTYTVSDGNGGTDTATVTITINGVNDDPVLTVNPNTGSVTEDAATPDLTASGTLSFTDVDATDTHNVTRSYNGDASWSSGGTLTPAQITALTDGFSADNNSWDYTVPNADVQFLAAGETVTFSYDVTVNDGHGGTDTATVTITINGVNDNPTAGDDDGTGYSTDEDSAFTTASVLTNDTDPDTTDTLTVDSIDTSGTQGSVIDNGNGTFYYDPNGQFEYLALGETATDAFTYTVSDGHGGTDTATVTITINGVNDNPTAVDDASATDEDTPITVGAPGVLDNDFDVDTGHTVEVSTYDVTSTYGASIVVNADGSFTYDPTGSTTIQALAEGDDLIDSFTYTVSDGHGGTDTATVNITITGVNDNPTATNLTQTLTYTEDDSSFEINYIEVTDVDTGDTITATLTLADVNAGVLTASSGNGETYNDSTGVWTITGTVSEVNPALAAVMFTPAADYDQDTTISVQIRDTANTVPATGIITLDVTPVNDAPINTVPVDQVTTHVNEPVTFSGGFSVSDDSGSGDILVTLTATNGTVNFGGSSGAEVSMQDTLTNINTALAGMIFTPKHGWSGVAQLMISTDDNGWTGGSSSPNLNDTDTINIYVLTTDIFGTDYLEVHLSGSGGSGVNYIPTSGFNEIIYGTPYDDTIDCGDIARMFWIYAGDGDDHVIGGRRADLIYGEGGDDFIFGGNAQDDIYGGSGNDQLGGGRGDDVIFGDDWDRGHWIDSPPPGTTHDDSIYGDEGNDTLYGCIGDDRIYGGIGEDEIYGDNGNDYIYVSRDGSADEVIAYEQYYEGPRPGQWDWVYLSPDEGDTVYCTPADYLVELSPWD